PHAYSVNEICVAVKNNDLKTFEKHVDLDKIADKSFDDPIAAQRRISGDNFMNNAFTMGIINNLRPGFVSMLKSMAVNAIAGDDKKDQPDQKGAHDIGHSSPKALKRSTTSRT
ncbi:MAG: hypothetical protein LUF25_04970, partial [Phascolarctobacterium sp.]|nr:hypothetical protein [Phascolarctobacterium sp.]